MNMPLIIDGHNLLWSIEKTSPVGSTPNKRRDRLNKYERTSNGASEEFGPITEVRLCQIVGRYLKLTGGKCEIVFDGTGPADKSGFDNINNLEVFFAGVGTDADTVIEDKIRASTAPRRLTVVSSDRKLRDAARARKATVVKSQVFWSNLLRRLSRGKRIREPTAKRLGLSESETEQWLKFFGLEE